jgi:hypothetical protein
VGRPRGCDTAYKGRVDRLGVRAKVARRAREATDRPRGRVRPGYAMSGMIGGGHLSSAARGGGGEAGWRWWLDGPAGPHDGVLDWAAKRGMLGCHAEQDHNQELLLLGCWAR